MLADSFLKINKMILTGINLITPNEIRMKTLSFL